MLALLTLGCFMRQPPDVLITEGPEGPKDPGVVGVLPVAMLSDLEGTQETWEVFRSGTYVGNLVHSGGYIQEDEGAAGLQTRSKEYAFNSQGEYREAIATLVYQDITTTLTELDVSWRPLDAEPPVPTRSAVRGTHELDGTDNVNLPRFALFPGTLEPMADQGVDHVLAPVVVLYYSHNAGWFFGQHTGSHAGARMRVFWALHDAVTGSPVAWRDVEARFVFEEVFQPSSAQTEDALIVVERYQREELEQLPH
jgi:hypothetical protein